MSSDFAASRKKAKEKSSILPPYILGASNFKNILPVPLKTGRGLFAARDIKKGEVVFKLKAKKNEVCILNRHEYQKLLQENPSWLPDAALFYSHWIIMDLRVKDGKYLGKGSEWYALNHCSTSPNLWAELIETRKVVKAGKEDRSNNNKKEMKKEVSRPNGVKWIALRTIKKGTQLCFQYQDDPVAWEREVDVVHPTWKPLKS